MVIFSGGLWGRTSLRNRASHAGTRIVSSSVRREGFYEGEQMLFIHPGRVHRLRCLPAGRPVTAIFAEDALPEQGPTTRSSTPKWRSVPNIKEKLRLLAQG